MNLVQIVPSICNFQVLRDRLGDGRWEPGVLTAGTHGQNLKQSTQLAGGAVANSISDELARALMASPQVSRFCFSRRVSHVRVCRYNTGDYYRPHVDKPVQLGVRADISFTVFLSRPDEYDGGELTLGLNGESGIPMKLPAGHAVLYETGIHHHVAQIRRGERIVAVGWIESAIRCQHTRSILRDLYDVLEIVDSETRDLAAARLSLSRAITALMRSRMTVD